MVLPFGPGMVICTGAVESGQPPPLGQSEGYGVQGQPYARPYHRAVDADELQIAP